MSSCGSAMSILTGVAALCGLGMAADGELFFSPILKLKARAVIVSVQDEKVHEYALPQERGALSPDGKLLIKLGSAEGAKGFDLFVSDADKPPAPEHTRRVTDLDGAVYGGQWMPDSRHVVFTTGHDRDRNIWIVDAAAAEEDESLPRPRVGRFSAGKDATFDPQVASDGKVSYLTLRARNGKMQYMDLVVRDGDVFDTIVKREFVFSHTWSPDGRYIAYSVIGELRIRDMVTAQVRSVKYDQIDERFANTAAYHIAFSPDGKWLACTPRFVGGRSSMLSGDGKMEMMFPDDKVVVIPIDCDAKAARVLKGEPNVLGLSWGITPC